MIHEELQNVHISWTDVVKGHGMITAAIEALNNNGIKELARA